jgi:hypothetical protein
MRQEIEASLRREWEAKTQLEINRLVPLEIERFQKKFDQELQQLATASGCSFLEVLEDSQRKVLPPSRSGRKISLFTNLQRTSLSGGF